MASLPDPRKIIYRGSVSFEARNKWIKNLTFSKLNTWDFLEKYVKFWIWLLKPFAEFIQKMLTKHSKPLPIYSPERTTGMYNNPDIGLSWMMSYQHLLMMIQTQCFPSYLLCIFAKSTIYCWLNWRLYWIIEICRSETFTWCMIHAMLINLSLKKINVNFLKF